VHSSSCEERATDRRSRACSGSHSLRPRRVSCAARRGAKLPPVLRAACAIALLLLVVGCETGGGAVVQAGSAPTSSSAAVVDRRTLERWLHWTMTRGDGLDDPAPPACGADPGSQLWFLAAHDTTRSDRHYDCVMPSGRALLVVAVSITSADKPLCEQGLTRAVGGDAVAAFDGGPVPLSVTQIEEPATPGTVWMCDELIWGTVPPVTAGQHRIILTHTDGVTSAATATVDVTAQ
jgi:hypothetical protein